jgi:hypothetical protein
MAFPADGSSLMIYVRIGLRALAVLCAIIVMGISADRLKDEISGTDLCVLGLEIPSDLNGDMNACNYGIGVGVLTVIIVLVFIALDIMSLRTEAFVNKSIFNIADLVSCGILSLLWLVGFIYILDKWDDSGPKDFVFDYDSRELKLEDKEEAVEAAIAFCFIGAIIWGVLAFMAVFRIKSATAAAT